MENTIVEFERATVSPLLRPLVAFLKAESSGGILLLMTSIGALIWANSSWGGFYEHFWHMPLSITVGASRFSMALDHWVNDGLMVVFFLLVGLEIKRELVIGELASLRKASLPIAAAIGGMLGPVLIFLAFNPSGPAQRGWGVPMATDIAFAVGMLTLVGRSLPASVRVFLLAIAIVDDLGAVLVIAIFYTNHISIAAALVAAGFLAALVLLNLFRVHRPLPYLLLGVGLWIATLCSGIHATIAGVLLAFTIPATRQIEEADYIKRAREALNGFAEFTASVPEKITPEQSDRLQLLELASQAVQTPLALVEHRLLKVVNFVIVPLFALANAGVDFRSGGLQSLREHVTWGIAIGLLLGKPLGVLGASWLTIRVGLAQLPDGAHWRQLPGIGVLCGIGFTMSLFIANLAFGENRQLLQDAKIGILLGSVVAGIVGAIVVLLTATRAGTARVRSVPA